MISATNFVNALCDDSCKFSFWIFLETGSSLISWLFGLQEFAEDPFALSLELFPKYIVEHLFVQTSAVHYDPVKFPVNEY